MPNIASYTWFHLYKVSSSLITTLQSSLPCLPATLCIFLFTSPQCFRNCHWFWTFLLRHDYIRFVVVDEVHLFVQFGNTCREEFCQLKALLFNILLQSPTVIPSIFMTATCTPPMIDNIAQLNDLVINHGYWPSPAEMSHQNVSIEARYTKHHYRVLKSSIRDALKPSPCWPDIQKKVIVYTNARSQAKDFAFKLGKFLDSTPHDHIIDILLLEPWQRRRKLSTPICSLMILRIDGLNLILCVQWAESEIPVSTRQGLELFNVLEYPNLFWTCTKKRVVLGQQVPPLLLDQVSWFKSWIIVI